MIKQLKKIIWNIRVHIRYCFSYLFIELSGKGKKSRKIINSLKDKYEGKRCFILGNGPSLSREDVEKLKNEVTFGSNRIYKMFEQTDWRPTYYAMFDEGVAQSEGVSENISLLPVLKFLRAEGWFAYRKIKGDVCFLHSWYSRKYLKKPVFSLELDRGIYTIATVTYSLIQIAVWMGFKEIYLLGCDNSYRLERNKDGSITVHNERKSYFGNQEKESATSVGSAWESNIAFEYAEKFSRENGFRIFNATRGGMLEAFERKNLDDVLKDAVHY